MAVAMALGIFRIFRLRAVMCVLVVRFGLSYRSAGIAMWVPEVAGSLGFFSQPITLLYGPAANAAGPQYCW